MKHVLAEIKALEGKLAASEQQTKRVSDDWKHIAGEPVEVEDVNGTFYGYCSELGTLRLFKKYHHLGDKANTGYSENMKKHYFRLEH